ncbi:hypothetical protein BT96DRAFT_1010648 [Gymnopus androsaceus JB14]|uniref:F-box domain-containing protein n=1 Tax=Gymnopus androsaceus JB14 TaxID=1447944 RepID=A0A6A4GAC2_9AGAR|nr:hypothetical protein BT96DRAFT_1010648 [Gymnopus androsaceus JB14]
MSSSVINRHLHTELVQEAGSNVPSALTTISYKSSLRSIPNELLLEIASQLMRVDTRDGIINLIQTCSRFRNVILGSQKTVTMVAITRPYAEPELKVLRTWLKRSNGAPLKAFVTLGAGARAAPLDFLLSCPNHFEILEVDIPDDMFSALLCARSDCITRLSIAEQPSGLDLRPWSRWIHSRLRGILKSQRTLTSLRIHVDKYTQSLPGFFTRMSLPVNISTVQEFEIVAHDLAGWAHWLRAQSTLFEMLDNKTSLKLRSFTLLYLLADGTFEKDRYVPDMEKFYHYRAQGVSIQIEVFSRDWFVGAEPVNGGYLYSF